jgi:RNA polymerase sigma-B factor
VTAELLARAAQTHDDAERRALWDEVVVLNMEVARSIAGRYRGRGIADDDLEQVSFVGLVKAVRRFQSEFEGDLLSYAVPTIRGEIRRHFRDRGWAVRPPRRIQELQGRIWEARDQLVQELGRSPRPSELAEFIGEELGDVVEALAAKECFTPTSLDRPVSPGATTVLADLQGGEDGNTGPAEARLVLAPAVRQLRERDRRILYLRFFEGCTQEEIAQEIGVTQMQVSRILSRIFAELRGQLQEPGTAAPRRARTRRVGQGRR